MRQAILKLVNLEIGYGSHTHSTALLPPLNLQLHSGEFVAVVGPNGAGKSTLFRTISGFQPALGGEVLLNARPIKKMNMAERARQLAVVFTDYPDDFYLKTEEVVTTGRYPYTDFWARLTKNDLRLIDESMDSCGVGQLKGRRLISLSDGERQKVMVAKALAQDTPLILLDEPAAFLDYPSKIELMELLRKLAKEQSKTILFSSHDLDLVLRNADKVWLVAHNQEVKDDIPEQLVLDGAINAYFDNNQLVFDSLKGHFIVQNTRSKTIFNAIEDNLIHKWASNALLRNGFEISEKEEENLMYISYSSDEFSLKKDGETHKFDKLADMIQYLNRLR